MFRTYSKQVYFPIYIWTILLQNLILASGKTWLIFSLFLLKFLSHLFNINLKFNTQQMSDLLFARLKYTH